MTFVIRYRVKLLIYTQTWKVQSHTLLDMWLLFYFISRHNAAFKWWYFWKQLAMKTSWHGNAFCITGLLQVEPPVDSRHKAPVIRIFDVFFVVSLNMMLSKHSSCRWCETPWRSFDVTIMLNYANPVYGVVTICHQVRWLRWGHPSLFHTATSLLIWYKMFCVRDIAYRLIWMECINMFSVYAQSGTHSRFNW